MTESYLATFQDTGGKPPDNLDWSRATDETMRIRFGIADDQNYRGRRMFENLELVYVTPDGSLPDMYCTLILDDVPSWVFP